MEQKENENNFTDDERKLYGADTENGETAKTADPEKRKGFIIAGAFAGAAVILNVILIILSSRQTEGLFRLIGITGAVVFGLTALYVILNVAFADRTVIALRLKALTSGKGDPNKKPGVLKRIWSDILLYLTSAFLLAVIFTFVWNVSLAVPAREKVVVYISAPSIEEGALRDVLEEEKPEGIRMIEVHSFDYAVFDGSDINRADIFIIPESLVNEYEPLLQDISPYVSDPSAEIFYGKEGKAVGFPIRKAGEKGRSSAYITYEKDTDETYVLCFNINSKRGGIRDEAVSAVWQKLLDLE